MRTACFFAVAVTTACASLTVDTTSGQVKGRFDDFTGTEYFYGIPYGKAERFAPPGDPEAWNGVKELGMLQPPVCPQAHLTEDIWFGKEDCLTVDVWRPGEAKAGDELAVMVWIYGGAFVFGAEDQINIYNGKKLAKNYNVVVVAMNYRVNSLGFLALPALFGEQNTTGNYGLLDQQYALKWVQRNIKNFGGNPDKVQIYGQSAGGCSVVAQLSIPSSHGLYASAAIESSIPVSNVMWVDKKNAYSFGEMYAEQVGCPSGPGQVDCLRTKPLSDVLNPLLEWRHTTPKNATWLPVMMPLMAWWPTIDGTTLPDTPHNLAKSGKLADVPTIIGTVENEGTIFVPGIPLVLNTTLDIPVVFPLEARGWKLTVGHLFGDGSATTEKVISFYEASHPKRENMTLYYTEVTADLLRDFFFVCPARYLQRAITSSPTRVSPLYVYHFNQTISSDLYKAFGDYHTSEIPYVHDLVDEWRKWTPSEVELAAKMSGFWTSLAKLETPSCPTCPPWTPFKTATQEGYMGFETPTAMRSHLYQQTCDFWDTIGYESVV